jgi:hypothetical protein
MIRGVPGEISEEKTIAKIVLDTERMKVHPYMSVLKLPLLVDLQQKVGQLIISITTAPSIIILENTLN